LLSFPYTNVEDEYKIRIIENENTRCYRGANKDYNRLLMIARVALEEVIYKETFRSMGEVGSLLGGLIKKLGQSFPDQPKNDQLTN